MTRYLQRLATRSQSRRTPQAVRATPPPPRSIPTEVGGFADGAPELIEATIAEKPLPRVSPDARETRFASTEAPPASDRIERSPSPSSSQHVAPAPLLAPPSSPPKKPLPAAFPRSGSPVGETGKWPAATPPLENEAQDAPRTSGQSSAATITSAVLQRATRPPLRAAIPENSPWMQPVRPRELPPRSPVATPATSKPEAVRSPAESRVATRSPPPSSRGATLHIGRIEVTVSAPTPVPAAVAPSRAASPAPLGLLSGSPMLGQRFGLGQS